MCPHQQHRYRSNFHHHHSFAITTLNSIAIESNSIYLCQITSFSLFSDHRWRINISSSIQIFYLLFKLQCRTDFLLNYNWFFFRQSLNGIDFSWELNGNWHHIRILYGIFTTELLFQSCIWRFFSFFFWSLLIFIIVVRYSFWLLTLYYGNLLFDKCWLLWKRLPISLFMHLLQLLLFLDDLTIFWPL